MKIQKSAIPYIILLIGLLLGIPTADELLQNEADSQIVNVEVKPERTFTDLRKLP